MKVVINKSKNRFWLSPKALKMICEDKNIDAFFYKKEFKADNKFAYKMTEEDFNNNDPDFIYTIYNKDFGNIVRLSNYRYKFSIREELEDMYEFKNRADTSLVKVVELLGKRAGLYCNLKVIEIPDSAFDIRAYTDGRCKEHLLYEIK